MITIKTQYLGQFVTPNQIENLNSSMINIRRNLIEKKGIGSDFLGWVNLPVEIPYELITDINECASRLNYKSDIIVVVGIGGSYLGAKAVIEALNSYFENDKTIIFAGNHLSEEYHYQLLEYLEDKNYSVIVISKSGTTTEPAIAFRLLKQHLQKKYGRLLAKNRIIAITDKEKGALKKMADEEGYRTYVIPDDVGGRYSVLTPVGLLPIACAGYDISKIIKGAAAIREYCLSHDSVFNNPCFLYAAIRHLLYKKGFPIEILVNYEPKLSFLTEWWKQLFGESEGKEGKGLFPVGVTNTTDLHSLGQMIQEGPRIMFETVLFPKKSEYNLSIPIDKENLDELNYISSRRLSYINEKAMTGTIMAHLEGNVPNILINFETIDEENIGQLIWFFEFSCAISGNLLNINPFDQPGVEFYKKNMFQLLGK